MWRCHTMIPVYIVSGFLGSGKTTFIQHLLGQMRDTGKVMVIENDFGEVSFDSALLKKQGIRFEELASGCICCTLAGDFKKSLHKVLQEASTDCIIIEPSGVAKLSDIIAVCQDKELTGAIRLARAVTVVDAQAGYMYAENFGEFFIDQIRCGQDIFLSHADENEDDTRMTIAAIRAENKTAPVHTDAWEDLDLPACLGVVSRAAAGSDCGCGRQHEHEHCECRAHDGAHHHDHAADAVFKTLTVYPVTERTAEEWIKRSEEYLAGAGGAVIRVKGVLPVAGGFIELQYSGRHIETEPSQSGRAALTVIGTALDEVAVRNTWT